MNIKQIIRNLTLATTLVTSLAACQTQPMMYQPQLNQMNPMMAQSRFQARSNPSISRQNLSQILPLLKQLYATEFADALENGQPMPDLQPILEQHGPAAFALLSQDRQAREELYPLSDQMVIREFSKPSPPDNVPPINAQELQSLLATMKPGDIILCGNNGSFIHGALYLGNGEIVHSLATQADMPDRFRGVVREALSTYTARSERDTFVVLRAAQASQRDLQQAMGFAVQQVGKGYDSLFLLASDERFYCTELVWHALRQMSRAPRVFPQKVKYGWEMVNVEDFMDSPDLSTVWERNYKRPAPGQRHRY